MKATQQQIFEAIQRERAYQDAKWGDKPHEVPGWLLIMRAELEEAMHAWAKGISDREALKEVLQVVAVGVACLEEHGLVERRALWEGEP